MVLIHYNLDRAIKRALTWIIIILLLLDRGAMYNQIEGFPLSASFVKTGLLGSCALRIILFKRIPKWGILSCAAICAAILLYAVGSHYNYSACINYAIVFAVLMLLFFGLVENREIEGFIEDFSLIATIMAAVSLFFWMFGSILHIIPGRPVSYYWGRDYAYTGYSYYYMYFENPVQAAGSIIRNTGLYTEAPGYAYRLFLPLCIEIFYRKQKLSSWKVIILTLALVSTLSSAAFILLVYVLGIKIMFYSKTKTKWSVFFHALIVLAAIAAGIILTRTIMQNEMATDSSSRARMDHLLSGIKTWLQHPLFGVGYNNMEAIALNHMYADTPEGASMGIVTFLAEGGLFMFSIYIGSGIAAYHYIRRSRGNRAKDYLFFASAVMIDWFISNVGYSTIMISLVCIGYATSMMGREDPVLLMERKIQFPPNKY